MKTKNQTLEKLANLRETILSEEKSKVQKILPPENPRELSPDYGPSEPAASRGASALKREKIMTRVEISVRLLDSAAAKLKSHTEASNWTIDTILDELIFDGLNVVYPAISYRSALLAQENAYCVFDRVSRRPGLRMKTGLGEYLVTPRRENEEYLHWLAVYQKRGDRRAHETASEMCVFTLQEKLQEYHGQGTVNIIFPEDFLVERLAP